jgi:hypothetical protein
MFCILYWESKCFFSVVKVEGPMSAALNILTSPDENSVPNVYDSSLCPDPEFSCEAGQTCCPLPDNQVWYFVFVERMEKQIDVVAYAMLNDVYWIV